MLYDFPALNETNPQDIQRVLEVAKMSPCHRFIELPDDFKFSEYQPSPVSRGLGDTIARFVQPIARSIDKVFRTDVANCAGCKNRQSALNTLIPFAVTGSI